MLVSTELPAAAAAPAVHPNHSYIVDTALQTVGREARMLDFGCGAGELVEYGRALGLDMVGADTFETGDQDGRGASEAGRLGTIVFRMDAGRLPFPDGHFDFVCANQVFEHVEDMDLALAEVRRVLKPGGTFLNLFPSMGTVREGHCGVPGAHWFGGSPRAQWLCLLLGRSIGLGYVTEGKSRREWATGFVDYLQRFTFYRSRREIHRAYGRHGFRPRHVEAQYAQYRLSLGGRGRAARLARRLDKLTAAAISSLSGVVIVATAP